MEQYEIAILALQLLILIGQLMLSAKINRQSQAKEKGYFLPEKSNISNDTKFLDTYDLHKRIGFYVAGGDDVIVKGMDVSVNGITRATDPIPRNTYYARDSRFGLLDITIPCIEKDYQRERNDVCIRIKCQNTSGYSYTETITMTLVKKNKYDWQMDAFNLSFV